jgi:iron(III) transport system ATP-binding protein
MAGISIRNLSKTYGDSEMAAVNDLTLEIANNQFVTLLGPSGCGKTTTLRLIAGYITPDRGSVHVDGRLISSPDMVVPPEHRGMGMVFQNYAIWPHKTVFENVVFGLRVRRVPAAAAREQVGQALALVNLTGYENRLPNELSGGQQQRVALARSLVVEPEILLLDEPLSNLDAKLRERMRGELKQLQRRTGITFIYVTHDQSEALALSDQIAVIHEGRLQQYGSPYEVYARPANRIVADFMGNVNLLPARIVGASNGSARLLVAETLAIEAPLPAGFSAGDEVDIAVRPENVLLEPSTEGDRAETRARVSDRTFLGNISEYYVTFGRDQSLRVQTHPKYEFAPGDTVRVALDTAQISIFPRLRGARPSDAA